MASLQAKQSQSYFNTGTTLKICMFLLVLSHSSLGSAGLPRPSKTDKRPKPTRDKILMPLSDSEIIDGCSCFISTLDNKKQIYLLSNEIGEAPGSAHGAFIKLLNDRDKESGKKVKPTIFKIKRSMKTGDTKSRFFESYQGKNFKMDVSYRNVFLCQRDMPESESCEVIRWEAKLKVKYGTKTQEIVGEAACGC